MTLHDIPLEQVPFIDLWWGDECPNSSLPSYRHAAADTGWDEDWIVYCECDCIPITTHWFVLPENGTSYICPYCTEGNHPVRR